MGCVERPDRIHRVATRPDALGLPACHATVFITIDDHASCDFRLDVTTAGAKSIDRPACVPYAKFERVPHTGSEQWQLDLQPMHWREAGTRGA